MINTIKKVFHFARRKKWVAGAAGVVIAITIYAVVSAAFGNAATTKYVVAAVEKGTFINSISGSGQVAVSNQVDIKTRASGAVVAMYVKNGQKYEKVKIEKGIESDTEVEVKSGLSENQQVVTNPQTIKK